MTNLNAQVPDLLYQQMASFAARQKVSLDQLITTALSAQLEGPKMSWKSEPSAEAGKRFSKFWLKCPMWNQKNMTGCSYSSPK